MHFFVVPPKIITKDDNSNLVVREGENLTLSCNATGHPTPHIVWRREDGEDIMLSSGKKGKTLLSKVLNIVNILLISCTCGKYSIRPDKNQQITHG